MTPHRPPAAARALLRLLLPGTVRDAFAGDLEERFHRLAARDPRRARRGYWRDVLSPSVLRFRREARGTPLPPGSPPGSGPGGGAVTSVLADLKFAVRTLARAPGFATVAVLSLALGIGPNTAIFSLVHTILFQDWGVEEPEGLIDVYTLTREGQHFFSRYGTFELVAEGTQDVFRGVAHHSLFAARIETTPDQAEMVLGEMVSGNYFDVMGVRAARGRTFLPEEDATPGTHPVVVVSDRFWRTRHGGDPGLVGSQIRMNGRPYTVVGIAPASFRGRLAPGVGSDFWVPYSTYPHLNPSKPTAGDLTISGRVRDGVPPGQAIAAVRTVAVRYNEEANAANPDRRSILVLGPVALADVKLHPNFDRVVTAMAALLLAAVGLVLLVACVNLAGFLLSRAVDRRKEMAIRFAMGAGRGAIARQLLVESLLLAGLGAALGLILGQVALRALLGVQLPLPFPLELEPRLDAPLFLFTAGAAAVAAVLFGLAPALDSTRAPAAATLRDEAGASGGRKKSGARGLLVAAQMALSTVLLFGAGLFFRSLQAATQVEVGFSREPAAVVKVEMDPNEHTPEQRAAFVDELWRRLEARPAVSTFGVTARMPLGLGTWILSFQIPGIEPPPDQNQHRLEMTRVTPGYFGAMGVPVLDGRDFDQGDRDGSPPVVILSEAAARQYWPGESAVGRVLYRGGDPGDALTVAGVVGNVKIWSLSEPPKPYAYLPYHQDGALPQFAVVARGNLPAGELAALVRNEARAVDPEVFLTEVGTLDDHLRYIYFLPRMAAVLLSLVAALALVLACIGLYGMVSYGVSRRTREMGIRMAIGADRGDVVRLVLGGGLTLVAVGGAVGIAASLGLGRLVEGFLFGVGGLDPLSAVAAALLLGSVACLAAYLPARRASRVHPVDALRTE